jgi:hypothetical protein
MWQINHAINCIIPVAGDVSNGYHWNMTTLKAHFDGKVLVPDEPVNLPVNRALKVQVEPVEPSAAPASEEKPLLKLLKAIEAMPSNPDWPPDGAAQHDHYLYGLPKRP